MKDVFQPEILNEILSRIETLTPNTQRLWGKMDVAQMMAHCSEVLKVAVGDEKPPRTFIGKIIGGFVKPILTNEKPFGKNSPTDATFKIADPKNFASEKEVLVGLLKRFAMGGKSSVTTHPHPFFGQLTPTEWSSATYKHSQSSFTAIRLLKLHAPSIVNKASSKNSLCYRYSSVTL